MKRKKLYKIIKISLITLLSSLAVLFITGFFILHSYISKIDLVTGSSSKKVSANIDDSTEEIEEYTETEASETETPDITDSPRKDIDAVEEDIRQNTEENKQNITNSKDVYNILLIGCDSREAGGSGRSDAMIIVSINSDTKKIILTSLLRDIYLSIPGHSNNRLNAAYAYGGADLLIETIESNFGIDIDKYVSIDFYAFIDTVDTLGGLTLDVTEQDVPIINDYIKELNRHFGKDESSDLLTQAGNYLLNGKQTLGYVRNRYNGTDFKRTDRQRTVLQKIFNKTKDLNLMELDKLANKVLPQVSTNLTEKKLISLFLSLPVYKDFEIVPLTIPMEGTYSFLTINKMSVLGINFSENSKELQKRIYGQ